MAIQPDPTKKQSRRLQIILQTFSNMDFYMLLLIVDIVLTAYYASIQ